MIDATCTYAGGCDRTVEVKKWELCGNHYRSMRQAGKIDTTRADLREAGLVSRDCKYDGCGRTRRGKDYCRAHENQLKKGGPLEPVKSMKSRAGTCKGDDGRCEGEIAGDELCRAHWYRQSKGLPLTEIKRRSSSLKGQPCISCAKHGDARKSVSHDGQCSTHSQRRMHGEQDWDRPIKHKSPDGTVAYTTRGYRVISRVNGSSSYEHRVIAQQLLGRPLEKGENVHHRNGVRDDNRTDGPLRIDPTSGRLRSGNLEIWTDPQPSGADVGPVLIWAVEKLTQYGQYDLDTVRRGLSSMTAILGQLGTPAERKACATFARAVSASGTESPGAELHSALF